MHDHLNRIDYLWFCWICGETVPQISDTLCKASTQLSVLSIGIEMATVGDDVAEHNLVTAEGGRLARIGGQIHTRAGNLYEGIHTRAGNLYDSAAGAAGQIRSARYVPRRLLSGYQGAEFTRTNRDTLMMTTLIGAIVLLVISSLLLAKYFTSPQDPNATLFLVFGCVVGVLTVLVAGLGFASRGAKGASGYNFGPGLEFDEDYQTHFAEPIIA